MSTIPTHPRHRSRLIPTALLLAALALPALLAQDLRAQRSDAGPSSVEGLFSGMSYRNVGPSRGGRVTAVAGHADHPFTFYMGAVGGGVWKTEDYGSGYSTPMPFKLGGKQLVAAFPGAGLVVLDAARGRQIAAHNWKTQHNMNAATPIVDGNLIFITSAYNTGAALLRLDGSALEVVWEHKQMKGKMATPVLIDGHLYGFDESKLKCIDLHTGKQKWEERGMGLGTLTAADGRLIIMSDDGKLVIARATHERFQSLDEAQIFDEDQGWIVPVLAGGRIYCRSGSGRLVCIDVGGDGGP